MNSRTSFLIVVLRPSDDQLASRAGTRLSPWEQTAGRGGYADVRPQGGGGAGGAGDCLRGGGDDRSAHDEDGDADSELTTTQPRSKGRA